MNYLPNMRRQRGQSTVEYLIIVGILVVALFTVGPSAGRMLTDAIRAFYASITFFLSLP